MRTYILSVETAFCYERAVPKAIMASRTVLATIRAKQIGNIFLSIDYNTRSFDLTLYFIEEFSKIRNDRKVGQLG